MTTVKSDVAQFIERIPDGSVENLKKLKWNAKELISNGWSATCITDNKQESLFLKIIKVPSQWSNEIHVCSDKNWRQFQLFGFLDNGTFYRKYGEPYALNDKIEKWNYQNATVGVILQKNKKPIIAIFYVNGKQQMSVDLPENIDTSKIVLSARVHPGGAMQIIAPDNK